MFPYLVTILIIFRIVFQSLIILFWNIYFFFLPSALGILVVWAFFILPIAPVSTHTRDDIVINFQKTLKAVIIINIQKAVNLCNEAYYRFQTWMCTMYVHSIYKALKIQWIPTCLCETHNYIYIYVFLFICIYILKYLKM